jgi:hypothetical protein
MLEILRAYIILCIPKKVSVEVNLKSSPSVLQMEVANETGTGMGIAILKIAESRGEEYLKKLGTADIKAARALSAEEIEKSIGGGVGGGFRPLADGYIIPRGLYSLYQAGRFNDTPREVLAVQP